MQHGGRHCSITRRLLAQAFPALCNAGDSDHQFAAGCEELPPMHESARDVALPVWERLPTLVLHSVCSELCQVW